MKISVIGTGYVGLVTGVCLAETGNVVVGYDIDEDKIALLNKGISPIYEPGLPELLERNLKEKRIKFTHSLDEAVKWGKIIYICLPTPSKENFVPDTSAIDDTLNKMVPLLKSMHDEKILVIRSTVPVGYTTKVRKKIEKATEGKCLVCCQPEFLRQGNAVEDFLKPSRIVIGTNYNECKSIFMDLYAPYLRSGNPLLFMSEVSAEMVKYAANCFLATRIAFINEINRLCVATGANLEDVRRGIGTDPRIGTHYLYPSLGFGGSCLPKDLKATIYMQRKHKVKSILMSAVLKTNQEQINWFINKIHQYFKGKIKNRKFAIWGVAFKANTDDIRESPALHVIDYLLKNKSIVYAYDPQALNNLAKIYGDKIQYGTEPYEILTGCDALIICTEWNEFRNPDFSIIREKMATPVVFDGRNLYSSTKMKEYGIQYISMSTS